MVKTVQEVDFAQKVKNGVKVIDVREVLEYTSGHIDGAINLPLSELGSEPIDLRKDEELYIICQAGGRSAMACEFFKGEGFTNVTNVASGMSAWTGEVVTD